MRGLCWGGAQQNTPLSCLAGGRGGSLEEQLLCPVLGEEGSVPLARLLPDTGLAAAELLLTRSDSDVP